MNNRKKKIKWLTVLFIPVIVGAFALVIGKQSNDLIDGYKTSSDSTELKEAMPNNQKKVMVKEKPKIPNPTCELHIIVKDGMSEKSIAGATVTVDGVPLGETNTYGVLKANVKRGRSGVQQEIEAHLGTKSGLVHATLCDGNKSIIYIK